MTLREILAQMFYDAVLHEWIVEVQDGTVTILRNHSDDQLVMLHFPLSALDDLRGLLDDLAAKRDAKAGHDEA